MFEELGYRLLHVHIQVALAELLGGWADPKSTLRPIFVKKLFERGNMLQKHRSLTLRII